MIDDQIPFRTFFCGTLSSASLTNFRWRTYLGWKHSNHLPAWEHRPKTRNPLLSGKDKVNNITSTIRNSLVENAMTVSGVFQCAPSPPGFAQPGFSRSNGNHPQREGTNWAPRICSCMAGLAPVWGHEFGVFGLCHVDLLKWGCANSGGFNPFGAGWVFSGKIPGEKSRKKLWENDSWIANCFKF